MLETEKVSGFNIIPGLKNTRLKKKISFWLEVCSAVVEQLPTMHKALDLIPRTTK
jgi:hypothetical protein